MAKITLDGAFMRGMLLRADPGTLRDKLVIETGGIVGSIAVEQEKGADMTPASLTTGAEVGLDNVHIDLRSGKRIWITVEGEPGREHLGIKLYDTKDGSHRFDHSTRIPIELVGVPA